MDTPIPQASPDLAPEGAVSYTRLTEHLVLTYERLLEQAHLCEFHLAELRRVAQIVHQCHHLDDPGTWEACSRPTCTEIRAYLEKHS